MAGDPLLEKLDADQKRAVTSKSRTLLLVAGAGSGKTEVIARRVAWWVSREGVPRDRTVAFTFTDAAAEELKFRVRKWLQLASPGQADNTLGGMYIGTIHGFCLQMLRKLKPATYHNFDVLDEAARMALVQQGFNSVLGLRGLQAKLTERAQESGKEYGVGTNDCASRFLSSYDLLNEYDRLEVDLPPGDAPDEIENEKEWCQQTKLRTPVGDDDAATAFAISVARYYAYLRCRRFLDFSTSQSELTRLLRGDKSTLQALREGVRRLVVDEVQDINPVQDALIRLIVGEEGHLTAVGDHRQAIYAFRGSRVELMANLEKEVDESIELRSNFRSTPNILDAANDWAETIPAIGRLANPRMTHGRQRRKDESPSHVALLSFREREAEADWIARQVERLVEKKQGAAHDTLEAERGITYGDVAVLLRSSTDARTFMNALRARSIPAIVRAGPDLFDQPEVLLFLACLARMSGLTELQGRELEERVDAALGVAPDTDGMIEAACYRLRQDRVPLDKDVEVRLKAASTALAERLSGERVSASVVEKLRSGPLKEFLSSKTQPRRRVFPQRLLHMLFAEADLGRWHHEGDRRGMTALFHLGQLSQLVKQLESPGWVPTDGLKYRIAGLAWWGSRNARPDEAPLLVAPDAVTVSTIHSAKGLEWPVVFVADVAANRFPSSRARHVRGVLFDEKKAGIDTTQLADDAAYSNERRLMYVALTRAERYLYVSWSGNKRSRFSRDLEEIFEDRKRPFIEDDAKWAPNIRLIDASGSADSRLSTSFSDLRYFLECPHDFYLRKVLGYAPGIDEVFGYGRGVHNLLREIHSDPMKWAALAVTRSKLDKELQRLVERGLVYLRYTTGDPAKAIKAKARRIVADYIETYAGELARLKFEPEREFETLLPEADALVSGAIDVVRLDDPPRVTLVDFKSGNKESDAKSKLDEALMRLQVSLYALAAKAELQYDPNRGLVRYLDEDDPNKRELAVPLDGPALDAARKQVVSAALAIKGRRFDVGPTQRVGQPVRCPKCDFGQWCGRPEAQSARRAGEAIH